MTGRRLGALAAGLVLGGGLLAHALDEEGLLPGVRESAQIRDFGEHGPARPLLYLGCAVVAALVGALVARAARRPTGIRPASLLGLVAGGQATLFASFEVVARLHAGLDVAEVFAEPAFVTGFVVQCLVAAAFVALLLLTASRLRALFAAPRVAWQPDRPAYVTRARTARVDTRRPEVPLRGRAPPFRIVTRPLDIRKDEPCRSAGSWPRQQCHCCSCPSAVPRRTRTRRPPPSPVTACSRQPTRPPLSRAPSPQA